MDRGGATMPRINFWAGQPLRSHSFCGMNVERDIGFSAYRIGLGAVEAVAFRALLLRCRQGIRSILPL